MADRGIVHYEEIKDAYTNDYPNRNYFSHIIDVILTNLNERDSINKIVDNPAHHTNKDTQLSGINNKTAETELNNAKNSINAANSPLRAADVNTIITNTEDLASTVAKPTTSTRVVNCEYYRSGLIVPTSYVPDHSGTYSTLQITIGKYDSLTTNDGKQIIFSGFSNLDPDYMQEITGYSEIPKFGQLDPKLIVVDATFSATIAAVFTYYIYDESSFQITNPKTVIVFEGSTNTFPSNISDGGFSFNITDTAFEFSISDVIQTVDGRMSYYSSGEIVDELNASEETTDELYAYLSINKALDIAEEAVICTNPALECENRRREYGYNKINELSPGYVWVCTNTSRVETYTITAGSAVNIAKVNAGDVVYASTFTTIAQYLRQVSQALDAYKSWWDNNGYCARNCQTSCQTACELACQHCVTSTCHDQNCGFS